MRLFMWNRGPFYQVLSLMPMSTETRVLELSGSLRVSYHRAWHAVLPCLLRSLHLPLDKQVPWKLVTELLSPASGLEPDCGKCPTRMSGRAYR